jgi:hypothetical protein
MPRAFDSSTQAGDVPVCLMRSKPRRIILYLYLSANFPLSGSGQRRNQNLLPQCHRTRLPCYFRAHERQTDEADGVGERPASAGARKGS